MQGANGGRQCLFELPQLFGDAARVLLTSPPSVPLRSLDALHLACALRCFARARRRGIAIGAFITADQTLAGAARLLGLSPVVPGDDA